MCTTDSAGKCREIQNPEISSVANESSKNHQDCSSEVISPAPTGTLETDSPVQEHASVQTDTEKLCPPTSGPIQKTSAAEILGFHKPEIKGKSYLDLSRSTGSSLSTTALCRTRVSASRRLSSPEKILNLHEQLQTTMKSSYQGQVSRGRLQQPRKCLSFPPAADLGPASLTAKRSISLNQTDTNSLPVTTALSKAKSTSAVTTTPVAKTTLYTAVTSRSAHVKVNPNMFTHHHFKAGVSKTTSALSSSLFIDPSRAESDSSSCSNTKIDPKQTKTNAAFTDISDAKHAASSPLTQRTTMVDSDVLICSDTHPRNTASDTTAQKVNHCNTPPQTNGAAPDYDGPVFPASRLSQLLAFL
nr:mucin-17-like isoform X1 [Labrus bergylta]XP_029135537.1 mucin-17-like isoform X1 [Labrus bergylta]XP_029135538.1 mucin-17-like isoform X1 [Labrus bergylta]